MPFVPTYRAQPPPFCVAEGCNVLGPNVSVANGVPLVDYRRLIGERPTGRGFCKSNRCSCPSALGASFSRCSVCHHHLPFVTAVCAQPPNPLAASGRHQMWCEVTIFCGVPLRGQFGVAFEQRPSGCRTTRNIWSWCHAFLRVDRTIPTRVDRNSAPAVCSGFDDLRNDINDLFITKSISDTHIQISYSAEIFANAYDLPSRQVEKPGLRLVLAAAHSRAVPVPAVIFHNQSPGRDHRITAVG